MTDGSKSILNLKELKIICVDDEIDILDIFSEAILKAGFVPVKFSSAIDALEFIKSESHNAVMILSDYKMPAMNGFEFRKLVLKDFGDIPFVIFSAFITTEMALDGLDLKLSGFIPKPFVEKQVLDCIQKYSPPRIQNLEEYKIIEVTFIEEAITILEHVENGLLTLENDRKNIEIIKLIAREVHTLKGSSGFLEVNTVTKYTHKFEDIIASLQRCEIEFTDDVYQVLLVGIDRLKELVDSIERKNLKKYNLEFLLQELNIQKIDLQTSTQKVLIQQPTQQNNENLKKDSQVIQIKESISVPILMLDELSNFSGEITVIRNMINKIIRSLEAQYSGNKEIQILSELFEEMHKINSTIQTQITDLRKVPLSSSFKNIPRIIRDLGHDLGKKIELEIKGDTLRVDNTLAAVCNNSLVHLIRNCVDHGIELPKNRLTLGKPESGSIKIKCNEDHDHVLIKISDDGNGIDASKIKTKAIEKGLFTEDQLEKMTQQQILGIIFSSGFSTAATISDVSGRGVGMDMVRSSVENVGGQIDIDTHVGIGSTFTLKLPVPKSVLIINSLLIDVKDKCFAIPQDSILRILRIEPPQTKSAIYLIADGAILNWNDKIYPLLSVANALNLEKTIFSQNLFDRVLEILIVSSDNIKYAMIVDAILNSEEIVVKNIQPCFNPHGVFKGATFMGDGTIGLILDIKGIAEISGLTEATQLNNQMQLNQNGTNGLNLSGNTKFLNYLIFKIGVKGTYGVPLTQVFRLEEIDVNLIQYSGEQKVVFYRDDIMPIYFLNSLLNLELDEKFKLENSEKLNILVSQSSSGVIGFCVSEVIDIIESNNEISDKICDRVGFVGNTFIKDKNITIIDIPTILEKVLSNISK